MYLQMRRIPLSHFLSYILAFGHNELWRPKAAKRVSVTFQMLWLSATMNCGDLAAAKFMTKLACNIGKWQHHLPQSSAALELLPQVELSRAYHILLLLLRKTRRPHIKT